MNDFSLDIVLMLIAVALAAALLRQLKRSALLREAERISRSIGDGDASGRDRQFKQLLTAYRLARTRSHLNGAASIYPAAAALVNESRMRQLERRGASYS
ncbi:MAG: hypothetical protein IT450_20595 [Phycisphaerales bacterium]|nr:hypothetical protein [Phycisphaerales bacterium]